MNGSNGLQPNVASVSVECGQRSRLLVFNRRVRHLHGISLRNLALTPSSPRSRGQTSDDAALPYALKSPAKLHALGEDQQIIHARSSGNLRRNSSLHDASDHQSAPGSPQSSKRPKPGHPRRRSTLDWTSGSPQQRQKRYENAIAQHTADIFFSVHVPKAEEPVYVSEVVQNSMNPDFRFFDLTVCHSAVTRSTDVTLKFWTKHSNESSWQYLLESSINISSLYYLGKSLEMQDELFAENTVLAHLSDGIYSCPLIDDAMPPPRLIPPLPEAGTRLPSSEPTSSYDELMRLSALDECIHDAMATQAGLIAEINGLLSPPEAGPTLTSIAVEAARDSLFSAGRAVTAANQRIQSARASISFLRTSLGSRKSSMRSGCDAQDRALAHISSARPALAACRETHAATLDDMSGQRRRIAAGLQSVYPIEPSPSSPAMFTIRGLPLPNSVFTESDSPSEATVSAALGHAAHLTHLLAMYLATPLPYPLAPRSSASVVRDPISLFPGSRIFPLHLGVGEAGGGAAYSRFEYGVYLLNKDIEVLSGVVGHRVADIRQTLPNLGLVLFRVAGGERGVLPERLAGGVRGLLQKTEHHDEAEDQGGLQQGRKANGSARCVRDRHAKPLPVDCDISMAQAAPSRGYALEQ